MNDRRIRVLIAKVGLDGHDRGAKLLARTLKDSGMEVIYTGLRQTPEMVANAVVQEDADVLGLSFLAGDHLSLMPRIMKALKEKGAHGVIVLAGGIILKQHVSIMNEVGVDKVFLPGTPMKEIVNYIDHSLKIPQ